jgi:porphobilinogen synthase
MRELISRLDVNLPAERRPRRLRANPALRRLVRETRLDAAQLIAPLFVVSGRDRREPISSMPGHARLSPDLALAEARRLAALGVGGVLLFGIPDTKDPEGNGAADPDG